jgi:ABC-type nickel/cobalt efflux system permease component RcnA
MVSAREVSNFGGAARPRRTFLNAVKLITDILTGKDNLTYDAARVVGVLGAFAYIIFWCVQVYQSRHFDPQDADAYGKGLAIVLLATAGAVLIKKSTEPEALLREVDHHDGEHHEGDHHEGDHHEGDRR